MKKIDLLKEVYEGRLTDDEAEEVYMSYMYQCEGEWDFLDLLTLSRNECNANASSVYWSSIAKWRYEGWPDLCRVCGKPLVLDKWGVWLDDSQEDEWLMHLDCLKAAPSDEDEDESDR